MFFICDENILLFQTNRIRRERLTKNRGKECELEESAATRLRFGHHYRRGRIFLSGIPKER